ncbi:response regulator transcription factor [Culicoidibacter larvae]|uniref:Response regulator transcription factor n=2 Tax=Culicoidibacter larvae TaxID=2579976 RepID=A0A5R8Q906_9FIRM|nr:response regulator transcription factor [Culicoidibacter larvae]
MNMKYKVTGGTPMKKILFVDDDAKYQMLIKELLELDGYEVLTASNAMDGVEIYKNTDDIDLVISDLKMQTIDGLQLLSIIRKYNNQAKVIILTGSDNPHDELLGLDLRANEYLKKSIDISVLLKRIQLVLEQTVEISGQNILTSNFENIVVDKQNYKVQKNDIYYELTKTEFALLVYFLEHKNEVLNREDILKEVWRISNTFGDDRAVDTYVKKLRSKLRISSIYTVRGVGYEWVER